MGGAVVDLDLTHRFEPVELEAWRAQVRKELGGRDPETLHWRSPDGLSIEPLSTERAEPTRAAAPIPGAPPFVRGSRMEREWRIIVEPSGCDASSIVSSAIRAIDEGADGLWLPGSRCGWLRTRSDFDTLREIAAPIWIEGGTTGLARTWLEGSPGGLTVLSDPLAAFASSGSLPTSVETAFDELAEIVAGAVSHAPDARPLLVSARPYHEAGASAADELSIAMATGVAYLRGLSDAGRPLADLPRRMIFELGVGTDFFVDIAKLRAARLLWSKVLRTLGIDGPEQGLRMRARSSGRTATRIEPQLGLLRGTAAALGAVIGGAELITVAPHDELAGEPSAAAERMARNTQLILREESYLARVIDPAGGSYFLEASTEALARAAWAALQEIEHNGGVPRGLLDGSLAERVRRGAELRAAAIATRERGIVGVSRYPAPAAVLLPLAPASPCPGEEPKGMVRVEPIAPSRDAEPFEALRARATALREPRRTAWVLGVGAGSSLRPRMDFAREALEILGLRVEMREIRPSIGEVLEGVTDVPATLVPCAADEGYAEMLAGLVPGVRQRGALCIVGATRPTDALREAGADVFLHRGADLVAALGAVLSVLEHEEAS